MEIHFFMIAYLGIVLCFILALTFAGLFRFFDRKDLNIHKKRASHTLPTSRLGGWVGGLL